MDPEPQVRPLVRLQGEVSHGHLWQVFHGDLDFIDTLGLRHNASLTIAGMVDTPRVASPHRIVSLRARRSDLSNSSSGTTSTPSLTSASTVDDPQLSSPATSPRQVSVPLPATDDPIPVVVKFCRPGGWPFDLYDDEIEYSPDEAQAAIEREVQVYSQLVALQTTVIPRCYGIWHCEIDGEDLYAMVLERTGDQVAERLADLSPSNKYVFNSIKLMAG